MTSSSSTLNVLSLESKKQKITKTKKEPLSFKPEYNRDKNLTEFGKATLIDRYLLPGEKFQDMSLAKVRQYYGKI